jgi:hypothetical protein
MTESNIVPECYVDTKVAEILGQASKKYNHQHGCGDVANKLIELKDQISIGIVDEDLKKGPSPKYFSEFQVIKAENNLILKKHKERKQYLILICPEIEMWLKNDAAVVNIDPIAFGLPKDLLGFKKLTKRQDIDRNDGFKRFIKALVKENSPSITTLKNWIELFKSNQL